MNQISSVTEQTKSQNNTTFRTSQTFKNSTAKVWKEGKGWGAKNKYYRIGHQPTVLLGGAKPLKMGLSGSKDPENVALKGVPGPQPLSHIYIHASLPPEGAQTSSTTRSCQNVLRCRAQS